MSIRMRLKELVSAGELLFTPPTVVSSGAARDVFVSVDVFNFLNMGPGIDESFGEAAGRALAKIDTFAAGRTVVLGLDPLKKSPSTLVARNAPTQKGIVDLRISSYKPDARIFGAFAERDAIVFLTWAPKTGLHYATEVRRCRSMWDALFPNLSPLIGARHADYLSSNFLPG